MVQVRLLDKNDYPSVVNLLKSKNRISNTNTEDWDWETWDTYFDGYFRDPDSRVIGCFEDDKLKAFVIQKFLKQMPAWIMVLIGQDGDTGWHRQGHGEYLNNCLIDAVSIAESRGVFDVFYSVPTRWLNTTKRTQPTSPVWRRYDVYVDAIIPGNSEPVFPFHKFICGDKPKPHSRAIKRCSLKMENRSPYLNQEDKYTI